MHRRLRQFIDLDYDIPQKVKERLIATVIILWVALIGVQMVGKMMPELQSGEPPMGSE